MAFVSAEYIKTLQKTHDAKFWKVLDSSGKVCINKLDADIGLSGSQDLLQETLENCIGEYVVVKLYTIKPERKEAGVNSESGLTLKVRLDSSAQIGFHPGQKSNFQTLGQPSWMDMLQMNEKMNQLQLDKLRMELEQDKEESALTLAFNKAMENPQLIISALGAIFGKSNTPSPVAIAAPEAASLTNTLERLKGIDPDYQNTLSKMVTYLETNPGTIDQIKPIFGA
jgi:hypothetical protein